jgi:hypothetical protein
VTWNLVDTLRFPPSVNVNVKFVGLIVRESNVRESNIPINTMLYPLLDLCWYSEMFEMRKDGEGGEDLQVFINASRHSENSPEKSKKKEHVGALPRYRSSWQY